MGNFLFFLVVIFGGIYGEIREREFGFFFWTVVCIIRIRDFVDLVFIIGILYSGVVVEVVWLF